MWHFSIGTFCFLLNPYYYFFQYSNIFQPIYLNYFVHAFVNMNRFKTETNFIQAKAISHIHRNRTEKIECLQVYECFHIYAQTELKPNTEPKTCKNWISLYPATKVWRGIMLYPSVSVHPSVRPSVRPSVLTISDR